jgi:hypothetical protein
VLDRAALEDLLETVHVAQARVREELARPLEVEPPTTPEGVVVLEGLVETRSFGQRLSAERFRVVRLPEGERIAFLGRLVFPSTASEPAREMEISQVTEAGRLVEAEVVARQGDEELGFQGLLVGGTWRMRRMLGGQQIDATSTPAGPAIVDAGSVTSLLVLGQTPLAERVPVVVLHQALAPESVVWRMELDDRGNHQVRTHVGRIAFRFDDVGAPEKALVAVGTSTVETVLVERDAFGGGGLPLPEAKRARIRELRAAEATGPAPEATGPDETGAEDPGGEEDG